MEVTNFKTFNALTPEALEDRMLGVGGSDAAAVLGISRYSTPFDIYQDKKGYSEPFDGNFSTMLGDYIEDFALKVYSQEKGLDLIKPPKTMKFIHKDYPWMRCTPDFISRDTKVVGEIKFSSFDDTWGEEGTDEFPKEHLIQCAHNRIVTASVTGIDYETFTYVVVGHGARKREIREYFYKKNEKLEALIIEEERNFWINNVEKEQPPEPVSLSEANIIYGAGEEEPMECTPELLVFNDSRRAIKDQMKSLKGEDEQVKLQIAKLMKDKTCVSSVDGKSIIRWNPQTSNRFDTTRFKQEHPETYKEYLKESITRPMRFM